jgi:hypothetical protein
MRRLLSQWGVLLLALSALGTSLSAQATPDIRVLIDVSGSMKITDPHNLRVPALRLLAVLLPIGSTAGVWMFDQGVTPLVPLGTVDAKWKTLARANATKIHSQGLFTNIEAALVAASRDWAMGVPGHDRHIVLLTDGKVDVSKDAPASQASRARVLGELLGQLKAKGVRVHTIALSKDVDAALLTDLATGTDGWREDAPTAEALQRAFLHIFEQAAAPDTLSLVDNRFTVDASVSEVTLLIFRAANAPPLEFTSPNETRSSASNPQPGIRWQQEGGYDLVTIEKPTPGIWAFNGTTDPDNRALVVTDLSLAVNDLPTHLMAGETVLIRAHLEEHNQPIARDEFLQLVKADVSFSDSKGEGEVVELPLDAATHAFSNSAGASLKAGIYEVVVRTQSGTFDREKRRRLQVYGEPLSAKISAPAPSTDQGATVNVTLSLNAKLVDPASLSGYVLLTGPAGLRDVQALDASDDPETAISFKAPLGGTYQADVTAFLTTLDGRALHLQPATLQVEVVAPPPVANAPPNTPSISPAPTTTASISALQTLIIVLCGNVLLAALVGPVWYVLRRRDIPSKGVSL